MSTSASEIHWDDDLITGQPGTSSMLPPPPEERVDLEQLLRDHAGEVPTLAITIRPDEPRRASLAPSVRPAAASRQRGLQVVIALAAGIAAAAIVGSLDRDEPVDDARARLAPTEVTDVGALAPAPAAQIQTADALGVSALPAAVGAPVAVDAIPEPLAAPSMPSRTARAPSSARVARPVEAIAAPVAVPAAPVEAPAAELSRDDVRRVMESLRPSLLACADGANGRLELQLVVHPSGRVQSSLVEGAFVGRSQGSCMARTGRAARFPAIADAAPTTVRYPYSL